MTGLPVVLRTKAERDSAEFAVPEIDSFRAQRDLCREWNAGYRRGRQSGRATQIPRGGGLADFAFVLGSAVGAGDPQFAAAVYAAVTSELEHAKLLPRGTFAAHCRKGRAPSKGGAA